MIPRFHRAVCGSFGIATWKSSRGDKPERGLLKARILKDRAERSASAVRERVRPALAIVRDESVDDHGLHRMGENADRGAVAAQNKITRSCALRFGFAIARASSDLWDFCNARQMFSPSHIAGRISRFNVTRIQQYSGGEE